MGIAEKEALKRGMEEKSIERLGMLHSQSRQIQRSRHEQQQGLRIFGIRSGRGKPDVC